MKYLGLAILMAIILGVLYSKYPTYFWNQKQEEVSSEIKTTLLQHHEFKALSAEHLDKITQCVKDRQLAFLVKTECNPHSKDLKECLAKHNQKGQVIIDTQDCQRQIKNTL